MVSSVRTRRSPEKAFWWCFVPSLVVANGVALAVAAVDKSWTAFGVLVVFGPVMNALFAIVGGLAAWPLKKKNPELHLARHLSITIGSALLACLALCGSIYSMDLHGC